MLKQFRAELNKARAAYFNKGVLKSQSHLLQPGIWVFSGWELWFRVGSRVPVHLKVSKGNRRGPLFYRALKFFISPAFWFIVGNSGHSSEYFAAVRGPSRSRETILFSENNVLRVLKKPRDPYQVSLRQVWDRYVSNSAVVEQLSNESHFVEQLVKKGTTATNCPLTLRRRAIVNVAREYAEMASAVEFGTLADHGPEIRQRMASMQHLPLLEKAIEIVGEGNFWGQRLIPMGSDASPDNALISDDGIAFFVDTEPIYLRPTIAHPISIIASWDDKHKTLVGAYLSGEFDDILSSLLDRKIEPGGLDRRSRMAWLVIAIATPLIRPPVRRRRIRPTDRMLDQYGMVHIVRLELQAKAVN